MRSSLSIVVATAVLAIGAMAQEPSANSELAAAMDGMALPTLSDAELGKVVKALPELLQFAKTSPDSAKLLADIAALGEKRTQAEGRPAGTGGMEKNCVMSLATSATVMLSIKDAGKFDAFAQKYGFADGQDFLKWFTPVSLAYGVFQLEALAAQMKDTPGGAAANSKATMTAQIAAMKKLLSPENIRAVKAEIPKIDKILEDFLKSK